MRLRHRGANDLHCLLPKSECQTARRDPIGSSEKVYCYLELNNVTANTSFTYVWTFGLNEMARVTQTATRTVAKYRIWSSKILGGMKGDWKVDLVDANGTVLKSAAFKVE